MNITVTLSNKNYRHIYEGEYGTHPLAFCAGILKQIPNARGRQFEFIISNEPMKFGIAVEISRPIQAWKWSSDRLKTHSVHSLSHYFITDNHHITAIMNEFGLPKGGTLYVRARRIRRVKPEDQKTIQVTVTEEHRAKARHYGDIDNCILATALKDKYPQATIVVGGIDAEINGRDFNIVDHLSIEGLYSAELPKVVTLEKKN